MLDLKTVKKISDVLLVKSQQDPSYITSVKKHGIGTYEVNVESKITILINRSFIVSVVMYESNPHYDPNNGRFFSNRLIANQTEFFNIAGPFSSLFNNIKKIVNDIEQLEQDKKRMEMMRKIDKMFDITGSVLEQDVLGDKK